MGNDFVAVVVIPSDLQVQMRRFPYENAASSDRALLCTHAVVVDQQILVFDTELDNTSALTTRAQARKFDVNREEIYLPSTAAIKALRQNGVVIEVITRWQIYFNAADRS